MKLPFEVRERFRQFGRAGGRKRAARLAPEARRSASSRAARSRWIRQRFGASSFELSGLPGGRLVDAGLADLAEGKVTSESLAVSVAAPRLRREGVPLGRRVEDDPEDRLYALIADGAGALAHARYGAVLRELVSFADACRQVRRWRERHAG